MNVARVQVVTVSTRERVSCTLVSGHIKIVEISYPCMRHTPTFGTQFWGKKVRLVHGWIRYVFGGFTAPESDSRSVGSRVLGGVSPPSPIDTDSLRHSYCRFSTLIAVHNRCTHTHTHRHRHTHTELTCSAHTHTHTHTHKAGQRPAPLETWEVRCDF